MSTFALSAAIMAVCLMFQTPILYGIFGHVESSVMQNCEIYFFWSALSYPFLGIYNSGSCNIPFYGKFKDFHVHLGNHELVERMRQCHPNFRFRHGSSGRGHCHLYFSNIGRCAHCAAAAYTAQPYSVGFSSRIFPKMGNGQKHFEDWRAHWFGKRMFQVGKFWFRVWLHLLERLLLQPTQYLEQLPGCLSFQALLPVLQW